MKIGRRDVLQAMSVGAALAPVLSLESALASENDSSSQDTIQCATRRRLWAPGLTTTL
jgi:hypothetical protein